jgi:hypothetical protein
MDLTIRQNSPGAGKRKLIAARRQRSRYLLQRILIATHMTQSLRIAEPIVKFLKDQLLRQYKFIIAVLGL